MTLLGRVVKSRLRCSALACSIMAMANGPAVAARRKMLIQCVLVLMRRPTKFRPLLFHRFLACPPPTSPTAVGRGQDVVLSRKGPLVDMFLTQNHVNSQKVCLRE